MSEFECPLCGQRENCKKIMTGENGYISFHCEHFHADFSLDDNIINLSETALKGTLLNLVAEHLLRQKFCNVQGMNCKWHFFYAPSYHKSENDPPQYINLADLIHNYPDNVSDVANRSLMNLSIRFPNYGDTICLSPYDKRIVFEHNINNNRTYGTLEILTDMGYLKDPRKNHAYIITAEGWKKIDALKKKNLIRKQAFIAMQFGDETKNIREAFRQAITGSGYSVKIIDEKEHNNQIVPEIFFEIEQSLFVVVDISYPNYGAYYEAGYAQALGKEVIVCCSKDKFDNPDTRPHFDIAQKSMIIWDDENDLICRLKRRIEATVR